MWGRVEVEPLLLITFVLLALSSGILLPLLLLPLLPLRTGVTQTVVRDKEEPDADGIIADDFLPCISA